MSDRSAPPKYEESLTVVDLTGQPAVNGVHYCIDRTLVAWDSSVSLHTSVPDRVYSTQPLQLDRIRAHHLISCCCFQYRIRNSVFTPRGLRYEREIESTVGMAVVHVNSIAGGYVKNSVVRTTLRVLFYSFPSPISFM